MRQLLGLALAATCALSATVFTAPTGSPALEIPLNGRPPLHARTAPTHQAPISVNPATQRLVDGEGREVFFHGANVVVKGFPWAPETANWTPDTSFSRRDWALFEEMGLNAIRLGTMWPGAEPVRGQYNQSYLGLVAGIVRNASDYGIYSLLDMHQDVMSEKFCGEGVPLWAAQPNVSNFPFPVDKPYVNKSASDVPTAAECAQRAWAEYYFTEATATAFQNLYTNANGLLDAWAGFWAEVARTVVAHGLNGAVLGYELINEPFAGDVFAQPDLIVPGVADAKLLQPAYEVLQRAIRAVDTAHALFFEGVTWDWFNVGFTEVPGGAQWRNKSVLSYHLYFPMPDFSLPVQYWARQEDMRRLQCGGFLTEFGIQKCNGCGDVQPTVIMDAADEHKQSWLYWEYKPFVGYKTGHSSSFWLPNGTLDIAMAKTISRTYPLAVAGHVVNMSFNVSTQPDGTNAVFRLSYVTDPNVRSAVTEIYCNDALHYPNGRTVSYTASAGSVQLKVNTSVVNRVFVEVSPFPPPAGVTVWVDVYGTPSA